MTSSVRYIQIPIDQRRALYERMIKEEVIFYDDFEDLMVRIDPVEGYFIKRKGTSEFCTAHGSKLVAEAIRGGKVVDRLQYDAY